MKSIRDQVEYAITEATRTVSNLEDVSFKYDEELNYIEIYVLVKNKRGLLVGYRNNLKSSKKNEEIMEEIKFYYPEYFI